MSGHKKDDSSGWGCLLLIGLAFIMFPGLFKFIFWLIIILVIIVFIFSGSSNEEPVSTNDSLNSSNEESDEGQSYSSYNNESEATNTTKTSNLYKENDSSPENQTRTDKNVNIHEDQEKKEFNPSWVTDTDSRKKHNLREKLHINNKAQFYALNPINMHEIELYNYIKNSLKDYDSDLTSRIWSEVSSKGQFDTINTLDDLATYCGMLHDTIADIITTIKNAVSNPNSQEYLSEAYLDSLFPSFQHILHRYELQRDKPTTIEFHRNQLLVDTNNKNNKNNLLDNSHFKNLIILFLKIDQLARDIGKNYYTTRLELKELNFSAFRFESGFNIANELVMREVIYISNNSSKESNQDRSICGEGLESENEKISLKTNSLKKRDHSEKIMKFNVAGISFRDKNVSEALDYLALNTPGFNYYKGFKDDIIKIRAISVLKYEELVTSDFKLIPEPDNKYDSYAIKVIIGNKYHVGYIPKEINQEILEMISKDGLSYKGVLKVVGGPLKKYDVNKEKVIVDTSYAVGFEIKLNFSDMRYPDEEFLKLDNKSNFKTKDNTYYNKYDDPHYQEMIAELDFERRSNLADDMDWHETSGRLPTDAEINEHYEDLEDMYKNY